MILADGSAKPFRGKGTFELEVEGERALQEVWIAGIELEGILGTDFMPRYGCQIIAAPGPGCSKPGISENLDFSFVIFGCGYLYVYIVSPSGLSLKNLTLR